MPKHPVPSVETLIDQYGYHGEHPAQPVSMYQDQVASGLTRLGYWEWVFVSLEESNTCNLVTSTKP